MSTDDSISLLIKPATKDLGEFSVRRALPDPRRQRIGPFIFFDHMGPAEFPPDSGVNVRAHPHIGLATITYLFEGEILHRDSLGYVQAIQPGAVNWMTAGKGIVHSEKVTPDIKASGQKLHGLQVWVALPTDREEIEPRFEHYPDAEIPWTELPKTRIRVVVGAAYGQESPVKTESETLYVELQLEADATIELPVVEELGVYVIDGDVKIGATTVSAGVLAVLQREAKCSMSSSSGAHVMLLGGATLEGERIIWWNFVSSSQERMEQARNDWRERRFPEVPEEIDFIPLPEV